MTTNFEEQVAALDEEKKTSLNEVDKKYGGLIEESDSMFREQIDAVQSYADKQSEIQQAQTDFAVQQMEQQKDQLEKDYTKEQSAAYVDFKKQTDAHGVNAEKIAAGGMWGSGYSESAQTAMYTEYQRRVATAKASFDQAVVEFDNAITQAKLQNNSVLAEIAFNALQQKLTLEMQMFTNRNSLLDAQASARAQVESNYLDVLEQLEENQYNTKPSMEDAFNKWVTYLQNEYKDGYISDETLWQELVDAYGETALKQAGFSNTEPTVGGDVAGSRYGTGFTTENGVFIPTGGVAGHYQPEKKAKGASATESSAQSTGTFSNGYQPKGISGHGKLKKSGETVTFDTQVQYGAEVGQTKTVSQNIWIAEDGTKWYWEGRQNRYIQYFDGSTYEEAVSYLKENGLTGTAASGIMTANEWMRRRNSYAKTGQGSVEVKNYASYEEYIQDYVQYCMGMASN